LEDGAGGVVVVLVFLDVVTVDDDVVVDPLSDPLELFWSDFDFDLESAGGSLLVVVVVAGGAVLVVGGTAASTRDPAVAPGRGSVLAGSAEAGDDGAPAEGLAGAASVGGDGGGTVVPGAGVGGSAWLALSGTERAAWRARRTSGRDIGDTPAVAKRDETSWTPNSPRSTPVAVPRAHVTTRTRRTAK
jgi:hypothetical protein